LNSGDATQDTVIILDFGSQYTQLIARRVRECNVYCEILPFHTPLEKLKQKGPKGLILSGGPASVYDAEAPRLAEDFFGQVDCPILGICYGLQLIVKQTGGEVEPSFHRGYGFARLTVGKTKSPLFSGLPETMDVWMSHGDHVTRLPEGFVETARTENVLNAVENEASRIYGVQFHPEVAHTPFGKDLIRNFLLDICRLKPDWSPASIVAEQTRRVRQIVGNGTVICGLSGGVDSTVAAAIVHRAIGNQQVCLFINNGLLREGEFEETSALYQKQMQLNVRAVDASEKFLDALKGVQDPEQKRRIIGKSFIEVFEEEAKKLGEVDYLVQGTLYPDVIESIPLKGPSSVIKSHHNVGGLPADMRLKLIEPLRELFKDEVREIGRILEVPLEILRRHPFPGPGLAVRIVGEIREEGLRKVRRSDMIIEEELKLAGIYENIWQGFAVLLPVYSVGVMGDNRTYEEVIAIRAVTSVDGMTADWARIPHDTLARISSRIVAEVKGVNRVVYDISSKPPSTIEWE
jgi:GMP synthase (glutamine-hydrolysing)